MALAVRPATPSDAEWLYVVDSHVPSDWVDRCIGHAEYLIAEMASGRVGFLRHSWFWGSLPFMDLIWVDAEQRRSGVGTALLQAWESKALERGPEILVTSSMSDEPEAQAWHRRNGFVESGAVTFGRAQPTPEVFFVKSLDIAPGV